MNFVKCNIESLIMSPFLKSQFVYYTLSLCMTFLQVSVSLSSRFYLHVYQYTQHKREETPDRSSNPKKLVNGGIRLLVCSNN